MEHCVAVRGATMPGSRARRAASDTGRVPSPTSLASAWPSPLGLVHLSLFCFSVLSFFLQSQSKRRVTMESDAWIVGGGTVPLVSSPTKRGETRAAKRLIRRHARTTPASDWPIVRRDARFRHTTARSRRYTSIGLAYQFWVGPSHAAARQAPRIQV